MPNFSKNQHFLPPDTHGLVIRTFALLPTNRVLICKTSLSWFLNWNLTFAALKIETRYNLLISIQETLNLFIWTCWIAFILNWIKIITLSLMLLLPPKNIACIRSVKFLSFVIMLYFFKSSIRHCMQYLSCLDRCSFLLLRYLGQAIETGIWGCLPNFCNLSWTSDSLLTCLVEAYFVSITLANVHLNCLNRFLLHVFVRGLFVTLTAWFCVPIPMYYEDSYIGTNSRLIHINSGFLGFSCFLFLLPKI